MKFDIGAFSVSKFDSILSRGLSYGLGTQGSQVCIEAAICETMGLQHGDDPGCVAPAVRDFKIALNDSPWSSPQARAKGLRDLGLAQLGSLGVVDDAEFAVSLSKKVITSLLPKLFRQVFPTNLKCLEAADRCEKGGTVQSAKYAAESAKYAAEYAVQSAKYAAEYAAKSAKYAAKSAAEYAAMSATMSATKSAKYAEYTAESAAESAKYAAEYAVQYAKYAVQSAKYAAEYAKSQNTDEYLILVANLALETLREMNSPGVALI